MVPKNQNYIVLSDLDGTLTEKRSSWEYIMKSLNLWDSHGKIHLEKFLNSTITYDEFLKLDVETWKGVSSDLFLEKVNEIRFREGVKELFEFFQFTKAKTYLISSGIMDLAIIAKDNFKIDEIYANELLRFNGKLNGKYIKQVGWNDDLSKGKIVLKILSTIDRQQTPVIALGDTSGDLPLIEHADLSFSCFSNDKELNLKATHVISNKDDFYKIPQIISEFLKQY